MHVRSLSSAEELYRYVGFAEEVYRGNPHWVPPDVHHLTGLLAGQKEAGPHWQVQAFVVEADGRILATLTAVVDELFNSHWNERTGHLLFFEALPEAEAAVAVLFRTACDWLSARGCRAARTSFLYGWQLPWTIDAYDVVPTIFHTYNPPYYHSYAKNAGFRTEQGMVQYEIAFTAELALRYREMVARAGASGVTLRPWRFDHLDEDTALFGRLVNETFAGHWGAPPFTVQQMHGMTAGMKDLLVPDFLAFAEVEGAPVGFVFALPDLNQALHRARVTPADTSPATASPVPPAFDAIDHGVLQIIGVQERHRGLGINLALAARSYLAMIAHGYTSASYTIVLDDNWPSRRTAERLGGRVTRNFIMYRRELAPRSSSTR